MPAQSPATGTQPGKNSLNAMSPEINPQIKPAAINPLYSP